MKKIRRALISVSDKTGISNLAKILVQYDIELLSTGRTTRHLERDGVQTREISEFTGFPEILDGRVKTLHPKIYGGLLAVRDNPEHIEQPSAHGMEPID